MSMRDYYVEQIERAMEGKSGRYAAEAAYDALIAWTPNYFEIVDGDCDLVFPEFDEMMEEAALWAGDDDHEVTVSFMLEYDRRVIDLTPWKEAAE